ncbi:MAG TPA: cysteine--tRNA ligase [Candidatus Saccharimonadales bacterium]|nr:cysteine--tRNA ligase [Candidatus Saccharimonadales bacterium]
MPSRLSLYNSLSRSKEEFKPISEGMVGIYSCGPTVYNFAHIGNMRHYIVADLLKRLLLHEGYKVRHVMNITDVGHLVGDANLGEDKIRLTAEHEHRSAHEVARFYTGEFLKDAKRLGLLAPEVMPKATDHIREMLSLIAKLDAKGYLYKIKTGIYFETRKFRDYGQLMGMDFEGLNEYLISGARVKRAAGIKSTTDFAVWRFSKPEETEMVWESEYGKGFPGWHIECSAMSMKYLGEHFDIHTGGIDHLPIHHTNEIAQSEASTGKKFVNFWFHVEFLQVDGKKMSKSLGNVFRLQDLLDRGYSINAYKYLIMSAYYRSQLNFTFEALDNAQSTLNGIYLFIKKLSSAKHAGGRKEDKEFVQRVARISEEFFESLRNDLNTPIALSKLHLLISEANKASERGMSKSEAKAVIDALLEFDGVLGLNLSEHSVKGELPEGAEELLRERQRARKDLDFKSADRLRQELKEKYGIVVEDKGTGTEWHFAP